jgi:DNA-binding NtrC family response regulator
MFFLKSKKIVKVKRMSISLELHLNDDVVVQRFVKELINIGRNEGNDFQIADRRVSGQHAQIRQVDQGYHYIDTGSKNGSMLIRNGQEIMLRPHQPCALEVEDEILLGDRLDPIKVKIRNFDKNALFSHDTMISHANLTSQIKEEQLTQLIYQLGLEDQVDQMISHTAQTILNKFLNFVTLSYFPFNPQESFQNSIQAISLDHLKKVTTFTKKNEKRSAEIFENALKAEMLPYLSESFQQKKISFYAYVRKNGDDVLNRVAVVIPFYVKDVHLGLFLIESLKKPEQEILAWLQAISSYLSAKLYLSQKLLVLHQSETELKKENQQLRQNQLDRKMIGESSVFKKVLHLLEKVNKNQAIVLLLGENGTGKELSARYLSQKAGLNFAALHCQALNEDQLDSELFGYDRLVQGHAQKKEGLFVKAKGGVVFLNEIQELPLSIQMKLVQVIKHKEVIPNGLHQTEPVQFKLVVSSSAQLKNAVKDGKLLEDLYYLISVFPIEMPRLKDRREDIPLLIQFFKDSAMSKHDTWIGEFSLEAMSFLIQYDWPGNVSQLENEIEKAVLLYAGQEKVEGTAFAHLKNTQNQSISYTKDQLILKHYDQKEKTTAYSKEKIIALMNDKQPLKEIMDDLEELVIRIRLNDFNQNRTKTAQSLDLSRQALQAKLAKWRISEADSEDQD